MRTWIAISLGLLLTTGLAIWILDGRSDGPEARPESDPATAGAR